MNVIAIDPGAVSGAFAITSDLWGLAVGDLPVVDGQLDAAALAQFIYTHELSAAVIERVGAMPKQGVASTFKFGKAVGIIEGVIGALGVPLHHVAPQTWKKHFKLAGPDKEKSRALAIHRFPAVAASLNLKKHHGRAEALLMLDWYLSTTGEH